MDCAGWVRVRTRVRLALSSAGVGFVLASTAIFALVFTNRSSLQFASTQTFAFAALTFGFGLLGWSGSVMVGDSVETAQRYLDTGTDWTQADSRRAMARIAGVGVGAMAGVIVATTLLR